VRQFDPLDPIECHENETHLKKMVMKKYQGHMQDVCFSNAKVLKEIEFRVAENYGDKWVADQDRLPLVENNDSRDVRLEFRSNSRPTDFDPNQLILVLSTMRLMLSSARLLDRRDATILVGSLII
jgi:hypothetical protein